MNKFFNTDIYPHLRNLQWQEIETSVLRVQVRFSTATPKGRKHSVDTDALQSLKSNYKF